MSRSPSSATSTATCLRWKPRSPTWTRVSVSDRILSGGGLDNRYCLGDLVGYGVFPNEVTERIRLRLSHADGQL